MKEITLSQVTDYARGYFSEEDPADRITEKEFAFEINQQSRAYLDTGDFMAMNIGGAPLIILKETGQVYTFGTDPEFQAAYEAESRQEFEAAIAGRDTEFARLDQLPVD